MATIESVVNVSEWAKLWEGLKSPDASTLCVFKRSPTCPISHTAEHAFSQFVGDLPENPKRNFILVDVISARPISQRIAADTGIRHESPQILLLAGGRKTVWTASHSEINSRTLSEHIVSA